MNMHEDFACPNCWGAGEHECACCSQDTTCEDCDGTGLDPDKVDIAKVKAWESEQLRHGGTCSLLDDKGRWIGRKGYRTDAVLRYADCLRNPLTDALRAGAERKEP